MTLEAVGIISAIFISVCALSVSIWQGYETRKNYRLSVRPKLELYMNYSDESCEMGIILENKGVGPAIIKKMNLEVDGELMSFFYKPEKYELLIKKMQRMMGDIAFADWAMNEYDVIAAGEKRPLIWLGEDTKHNRSIIRIVASFFSTITFFVDYQSIYGEKFEYTFLPTAQQQGIHN